LYTNIEKDSKHFNVMLLTESDKEVNAFSKWSMAYHELESDDMKNIGNMLFVNNFITIADLVEKPTNATKLFWYMSKQLLQD
jgi:hypothetical protein